MVRKIFGKKKNDDQETKLPINTGYIKAKPLFKDEPRDSFDAASYAMGKIAVEDYHLHYSIESFAQIANRQEDKGIAKYGKPLDPMDKKYDWLDMAAEELVDGFKYLQAEKRRRKVAAEALREIIHEHVEDKKELKEADFWLKHLM